jgi:hypothetical protein
MGRVFGIFLPFWLGFGPCAQNTPPLRETQQLQLEGYTIEIPARDQLVAHAVAEFPDGNFIQLLTRDWDGLIKTYTFRVDAAPSTGELVGPFYEGYAVDLPASLHLEPGEVPVRLVSSSCSNGSTYWAVASLSFNPDDPMRKVHYNLYVFGGNRRLFYKPQAGLELEQFVFRDIDGDCLPEMIDVNRSYSIAIVKVRVVSADGSVKEVQELSGDTADIGYGGGVNISSKYPNPDALCFVTRFVGTWSKQHRRYEGREIEH